MIFFDILKLIIVFVSDELKVSIANLAENEKPKTQEEYDTMWVDKLSSRVSTILNIPKEVYLKACGK